MAAALNTQSWRCNLVSEHVASGYTFSRSKFLNGFIPAPRLSNVRLSITMPKMCQRVAPTCATSSSQMDRQSTFQFKDEATATSEPLEDNKLKVTVNLSSKATKQAFEYVLENLRRSAPQVKGFRKTKGGKSSIPPAILYQMLGPKSVDKFVIEEVVSSSVVEYVEKEGIKAKKDFKTVQSNSELAGAFKAGKEFSFEAILELEDAETVDGDDSNPGSDTIEQEAVTVIEE